MNSKTVLIVAALAGLWWWHKKRGVADDTAKNTSQTPSTSQDAEGWMGAWGLSK